MIVKNYTTKICDICKEDLAVKKRMFYKNVGDYITLRGSSRWRRCSAVHICNDCWNKMKHQIVDIFGIKIR